MKFAITAVLMAVIPLAGCKPAQNAADFATVENIEGVAHPKNNSAVGHAEARRKRHIRFGQRALFQGNFNQRTVSGYAKLIPY